MNERVDFLNMFSDYEPPEPLKSALSQAAIVAADLDPAARKIHVAIHSDKYIPQYQLRVAQQDICEIYGLHELLLTATFPADQLTMIEPAELMELFVQQNSMTRGSLAGAQWSWEGQTLLIHLPANGKKVVRRRERHLQRGQICGDLRGSDSCRLHCERNTFCCLFRYFFALSMLSSSLVRGLKSSV